MCTLRFVAERSVHIVPTDASCRVLGPGASVRSVAAMLVSELVMSNYGTVGHAARDSKPEPAD